MHALVALVIALVATGTNSARPLAREQQEVAAVWSPCGGKSQFGKDAAVLACAAGSSCIRDSEWFWQCQPGINVDDVQVAIITPIRDEYRAVINVLDKAITNMTKAGRMLTIGKLSGKIVVVSVCGTGMNNAAMTAQLIIDMFPKLEYIINQGISGGINDKHRIGDVLIPKEWANYEHAKYIRTIESGSNLYAKFADASFPPSGFPNEFYLGDGGKAFGTKIPVPGLKPAAEVTPEILEAYKGQLITDGFSVPMKVEVITDPLWGITYDEPTMPGQMFWLPVSEKLLKAAEKAIPGITLLNGTEGNDLGYQPVVDIALRGVSSSVFMDNAQYRDVIYEKFQADVLEMEGAAIMHVCLTNKKECIVIRSVSDLAGGTEELNVILTFLAVASANTAAVTKAVIAQL